MAQGAMHPAWIRTGPIEYKAKKKKKNKLGAKAIFDRILVVILVTAIGGVASFFGFKTYFSNK